MQHGTHFFLLFPIRSHQIYVKLIILIDIWFEVVFARFENPIIHFNVTVLIKCNYALIILRYQDKKKF